MDHVGPTIIYFIIKQVCGGEFVIVSDSDQWDICLSSNYEEWCLVITLFYSLNTSDIRTVVVLTEFVSIQSVISEEFVTMWNKKKIISYFDNTWVRVIKLKRESLNGESRCVYFYELNLFISC